MRSWIIVVPIVSGIVWPAGNALAAMTMQEKENVQSLVWILEVVVLIVILVVAWFVWRISKRAAEHKKSKPGNSRD
jgi:heme/copper-type cytochrome/quinol oxidase subunit 2